MRGDNLELQDVVKIEEFFLYFTLVNIESVYLYPHDRYLKSAETLVRGGLQRLTTSPAR